MNFISKLQSEISEIDSLLMSRSERIQEFRSYLQSPKFNKVQSDGSRGDWISTTDVLMWLRYIEE